MRINERGKTLLKIDPRFYNNIVIDMIQVGSISFCNKQAWNIKDDNSKNIILEKIAKCTGGSVKIIRKHYSEFNKSRLSATTLISLRSNGNPYLLYCVELYGVKMVIFIDKKIKPQYLLPRMIITHLGIPGDYFYGDGTLLDGEMISGGSSPWVFNITDIFVLSGNYIGKSANIYTRLAHISAFIKAARDIPISGCKLAITRYYPISEIRYMLGDYMKSLNYTCRGIYFSGENGGYLPMLFNFDDSLIRAVDTTKYQDNMTNRFICDKPDIPIIPETPKIAEMESETENADIIELMTEQTDMPDVYNLYTISDDKAAIGIAYIENIAASHGMIAKFRENTRNRITRLKLRYKQRKMDDDFIYQPILD